MEKKKGWQLATFPHSVVQYHRRGGPSPSCSGWERVFRPRHGHQSEKRTDKCTGLRPCRGGRAAVRGRGECGGSVRHAVPLGGAPREICRLERSDADVRVGCRAVRGSCVLCFCRAGAGTAPDPVAGRGPVPCRQGRSGGQASRLISTGRLKPSPVLHLLPIDPVVFRVPSVPLAREGDLVFRGVWRLDAFSASPSAA